MILIYIGVRIGELFGVQKANVHITNGYMVGGEKTRAGRNRAIAFPDCIIPYVAAFYQDAPDGGTVNRWIRRR